MSGAYWPKENPIGGWLGSLGDGHFKGVGGHLLEPDLFAGALGGVAAALAVDGG